MKTNKLGFLSLFIILLSVEAFAYDVNIEWTFDKPNYEVELYKCTNSICSNYVNQIISTATQGYTYNMGYSADGTEYHAGFFYEQCYRPNGYTITTYDEFITQFSDDFEKKNQCKSEIAPLIVTYDGSLVTITSEIDSAFTVSDDAAGSPNFYPDSHRDYFTSDINVKLMLDGNVLSEQTMPLYQDTKQSVTFSFSKAGLVPGLHTAKVQTDPTDCICDQNNKIIRYRTVNIVVEEPANTPPVIEGVPDKTLQKNSGTNSMVIDLWSYAYDNESPDNELTFWITSQTNTAIVDCVIESNRYVTCTTQPNMHGHSDVTVRVTDPQGLYDEDVFTVHVMHDDHNCPPDVSDIPNQIIDSCHQFAQFDLDNYVSDPDNTDAELTWTYSGNSQLTININPTTHIVIVTYPTNFIGSETIRFTATDPHGLTDYDDATFTITQCQQQNTPPRLEGLPDKTLQKNSGLNSNLIDIWQYASDDQTPGNQLTFTITNQTNTAVVNCVIRDNRYLDCTTQQDKTGYSDVTLRVTDPQGLYDEDTVRIYVVYEEKDEEENDIEVSPSIEITRIVYDDQVKQGSYLHINIYVDGNKIKNTEAEIKIPGLNIVEKFDRFRAIEIKIPEYTKTGKYTMQIDVRSNKNENDRVYKQFFVNPKDQEEDPAGVSYSEDMQSEEYSGISGSVTGNTEKQDSDGLLNIVAIALTIVLVIVIVIVIVALTTKK